MTNHAAIRPFISLIVIPPEEQLQTLIPELDTIVDHNLIMNVNNLSDPNRVGTPSTNSGQLMNYVESTLVYKQLYIRNNSLNTLANDHYVALSCWIEYTKTTD